MDTLVIYPISQSIYYNILIFIYPILIFILPYIYGKVWRIFWSQWHVYLIEGWRMQRGGGAVSQLLGRA